MITSSRTIRIRTRDGETKGEIREITMDGAIRATIMGGETKEEATIMDGEIKVATIMDGAIKEVTITRVGRTKVAINKIYSLRDLMRSTKNGAITIFK